VTPETADDNDANYRIACVCGSDVARVISEYDDAEAFWLEPLVYQCTDCDFEGVLFDAREDGYDAVVNNFSAYEARTRDEFVTCAACGSDRHKILGEYRYQFEDEEAEEEWSDDDRVRTPDIFDSVAFELTCDQCGKKQELGGWECA
jgi:hypothetical protein